MQVELVAWRCCERHYPRNAMCIQKHMHHGQSNGCTQHLKCSPKTTLTQSLLPGKRWTISPKDEVKVQTFSLSDQQTVPNHLCSCHWASHLTASSVCQTLKFNFVTAIHKEIIFFKNLQYGPNGKGGWKISTMDSIPEPAFIFSFYNTHLRTKT